MKHIFAAMAAMTLAGCGDGETAENLSAADIERLAAPPEAEVDRSAILQPIPDTALVPAACELRRNGELLLLANSGDAVARVEDRLVRLRLSGPLGPSGGFFSADPLAISIGRTGETGEENREPALVQVTNRLTGTIREFDASWRCGGAGT